jgi:hypothetical protein
MTSRLVRPSTEANFGDHEDRIRRLERATPSASSSGELEALWWGNTPPLAVGAAGGVWTVPFIDGASVSWTLARAKFRLESASTTGGYTIKLQRSAAGGVFVPTDVVTLALAVGANEVVSTGPFGIATVTSGDLLRVFWSVIGANAQNFTVQLEGSS